MTQLTFQDALFKGYKEFSFRKTVYDLTEENVDKCWAKRKYEDGRDTLYLVDPELSYSMVLKPEEILYNATEDLRAGSYQDVCVSKEFQVWKKQTEKFVESLKDLTRTYNVTEIELIK